LGLLLLQLQLKLILLCLLQGDLLLNLSLLGLLLSMLLCIVLGLLVGNMLSMKLRLLLGIFLRLDLCSHLSIVLILQLLLLTSRDRLLHCIISKSFSFDVSLAFANCHGANQSRSIQIVEVLALVPFTQIDHRTASHSGDLHLLMSRQC